MVHDITSIAKALNIPLVVHFHGHDAYHYQYLADYRERLARMFDYASAIIRHLINWDFANRNLSRQHATTSAVDHRLEPVLAHAPR